MQYMIAHSQQQKTVENQSKFRHQWQGSQQAVDKKETVSSRQMNTVRSRRMNTAQMLEMWVVAVFNPEVSSLTQKRHPYTWNLNSKRSGDSKNAFLHCGDVSGWWRGQHWGGCISNHLDGHGVWCSVPLALAGLGALLLLQVTPFFVMQLTYNIQDGSCWKWQW